MDSDRLIKSWIRDESKLGIILLDYKGFTVNKRQSDTMLVTNVSKSLQSSSNVFKRTYCANKNSAKLIVSAAKQRILRNK